MRLELGTFPVRDVVFGSITRWRDGVLEINREAILAEVRRDRRITKAAMEIAKPGESTRIWPVRDAIEPRIKIEGPGMTYPGVAGRSIDTVGQGRTHRLSGMSLVEVSEVPPHDKGGDFNDVYYDMSGPFAEEFPLSGLINVCFIVEADPALTVLDQNDAVRRATFLVSDRLSETTKNLTAPQSEVFELKPVDPSLPKVVYIPCFHSAGAKAGNNAAGFYCTTTTYGMGQLTSPWLMHPNELLDGAISGPYRIASSWHIVNSPILLGLFQRHGVDLDFAGVIAVRTEWTTMSAKELMCQQTAKLARMLGAKGAIVAWDAGGNEFMEMIHTVRACEREGIRAVAMTVEDEATGGAPTLLEPLAEADAVVSLYLPPFVADPVPGVKRVVGSPTRLVGPVRNEILDVAGPQPAPRYNDSYGFGRLSGVEY